MEKSKERSDRIFLSQGAVWAQAWRLQKVVERADCCVRQVSVKTL